MDNSEYTIPDQVIIEVADSDLEGAGAVTVTAHSSIVTSGVDVALFETVRPGLFRGTLTLTDSGTPPATGLLPTTEADNFFVRYQDDSNSQFRLAYARVDTIPPVILNVSIDAQYTETLVDWETDEYTDATVEFGESPFFGGQTHRTSFDPQLGVSHSLLLNSLRPDKLYYYKIISRDLAGNVTELSTGPGGEPLTFVTLDPLTPPWTDDMELFGMNDWTVFSPDLSEEQWEQGNPGSGVIPHSGNFVWGSNRKGGVIGAVETFLVSPPVELDPSLGNRASLKYWQNYDFFSLNESIIIEGGELLVITNTASPPISLAAFIDDSSFGWEEQEFDLSPHIGKTVYFVWYYVFFAIENEQRMGWFIDDVSVTMQQIDPGALVITNNIAQATFNISGPISRSRQPWFYADSNAPPGDYTVTFNSVPYYQTPAPIVGSLLSGENLQISGNYTILDGNTNGISDLWEIDFLEQIDPNHSSTNDTDGDGLSDLIEFNVGTNPTNAASVLKLSAPTMSSNNVIQVRWPTASGRAYQLQSSTNVIDWQTLVDWYRASGGISEHEQLAPTDGTVLFRLRARP
jgi:hypothetical protein